MTPAPAYVSVVTPVAAPVAVPVVAPRVATAPASPAQGLPKVQGFNLPVGDLVQVAQGSGLSWVNSDPAKIAAVQAAIAAEPKPIRVPRDRPAPVQVVSSPLVLVETKRHLAELKLPFEDTSPEGASAQ
jgi:ribonuclease E